jgi:nitroreductase
MEYGELLKNRRSIRKYQDKPVADELLLELIKESTLAPSAGHSQQWRFTVVNNKAMMKRISDESKANLVKRIEANPQDRAKQYEQSLRNPDYNVFYNAPALIIVSGPANYKNAAVDCALCAGYLMNGAAARGLGTCWVNLGAEVRDPAMRAELGLTEDLMIVAPIIVGYPDSIPPARPRENPVILKMIH